jgi:Secretion system C-terminal sorting domain
MKRLLLVVLFTLTVCSIPSAELSVVWDFSYEDVETHKLLGLVPLANGEFFNFYLHRAIDEDPYLAHAVHFDRDGVILSDDIFSSSNLQMNTSAICPSVDGGAIACILTAEDQLSIYEWDAFGTFVDSTSFISYEDSDVYAAYQDPNGSIILGGEYPDLISISPDLSVNWYRNFYYGTDNTKVKQIVRRYSGVYGCYLQEDDGSRYDYSFITFTTNGTIREYRNMYGYFEDITMCPDEDTVVFLVNAGSGPNTSYLKKHDSWSIDLPSIQGFLERYYAVEPFGELSGYLCAGFRSVEGPDSTFFVEISEAGEQIEVLVHAGYRPYHLAAMMNGDMICAAEFYQAPTMRLGFLRISSGQTHAPVAVKIWLYNAPHRLPASGGRLHYRTLIGNDLEVATPITFSLLLNLPTDIEHHLGTTTTTLQPHEPISIPHREVRIPGIMPPGEYSLIVRAYDGDGNLLSKSHQTFTKAAPGEATDVSEPESHTVPTDNALSAPYPNPFNAETRISLTLPLPSEVSVVVYDIQGRIVATLAYNETREAGTHDFTLNGSELASGLYFVQATVPGQMNEIRKLVLVK